MRVLESHLNEVGVKILVFIRGVFSNSEYIYHSCFRIISGGIMCVFKFIFPFVIFLTIICGNKMAQNNPIDYKITIVYNNIPGDTTKGLSTGFGFSAWLEFGDDALLFDTGGDYVNLGDNLEKLKIDYKKMKAVFISHNHWDHVYGIPTAMGASKGIAKVYAPAKSAKSILEQYPRMTIEGIVEAKEILPNIWSTGEMEVTYREIIFTEQSMIINKEGGLYIITGCSHAGIIEIVKKAKSMFPGKVVKFVTGGFHLNQLGDDEVMKISNQFVELGVEKIAPSHCTGSRAIELFEEEWKGNFMRMNLGDNYSF